MSDTRISGCPRCISNYRIATYIASFDPQLNVRPLEYGVDIVLPRKPRHLHLSHRLQSMVRPYPRPGFLMHPSRDTQGTPQVPHGDFVSYRSYITRTPSPLTTRRVGCRILFPLGTSPPGATLSCSDSYSPDKITTR